MSLSMNEKLKVVPFWYDSSQRSITYYSRSRRVFIYRSYFLYYKPPIGLIISLSSCLHEKNDHGKMDELYKSVSSAEKRFVAVKVLTHNDLSIITSVSK
jgi:hypothetical protein